MTPLTPRQDRLCEESPWDFSALSALFVNCTLKRSPERSHSQGLADRSIAMPFTGLALATIAGIGLTLLAAGLALRRRREGADATRER